MRHFTKSFLIMQIFYSNRCFRYPTWTECDELSWMCRVRWTEDAIIRKRRRSWPVEVMEVPGFGCPRVSIRFSEILWAKASISHPVLLFKLFQLLEGKKGSTFSDIERCLLDLLLTKATFLNQDSYTNMLTKFLVTVSLVVQWRVSHFM